MIIDTHPVTSHDQSNFGKPPFFMEIQAGKTNSGFPKTFLGGTSYMLNIFATAA